MSHITYDKKIFKKLWFTSFKFWCWAICMLMLTLKNFTVIENLDEVYWPWQVTLHMTRKNSNRVEFWAQFSKKVFFGDVCDEKIIVVNIIDDVTWPWWFILYIKRPKFEQSKSWVILMPILMVEKLTVKEIVDNITRPWWLILQMVRSFWTMHNFWHNFWCWATFMLKPMVKNEHISFFET